MNIDFLKDNLNLEDLDSLENYNVGDVLCVDLDERGQKILKFKQINTPQPQIQPINLSEIEFDLKNIKSFNGDKGKILLSNGNNWIPTNLHDLVANNILISNYDEGQKFKTNHISFLGFEIKHTPLEDVVFLSEVDISKLKSTDENLNHGDVISFNKKLNRFTTQRPATPTNSLQHLLHISFNSEDLNIVKSYNIEKIEKRDNFIKIYNTIELPSVDVFPILSIVGAPNSFVFIKEIKKNNRRNGKKDIR